MSYEYICNECGSRVFSLHKHRRCSSCRGVVPLSQRRTIQLLSQILKASFERNEGMTPIVLEAGEWNSLLRVLVADMRYKVQLDNSEDKRIATLDILLDKMDHGEPLLHEEIEVVLGFYE